MDYFYCNGQKVPLRLNSDAVAVRFTAGIRLDTDALSHTARRILTTDSNAAGFVAPYGLSLFKLTSGKSEDVAPLLAQERVVDIATPIVCQGPAFSDEMLLTNRIVAQFRSGTSPELSERILSSLGLRIVEALGYAPNGFLLEV